MRGAGEPLATAESRTCRAHLQDTDVPDEPLIAYAGWSKRSTPRWIDVGSFAHSGRRHQIGRCLRPCPPNSDKLRPAGAPAQPNPAGRSFPAKRGAVRLSNPFCVTVFPARCRRESRLQTFLLKRTALRKMEAAGARWQAGAPAKTPAAAAFRKGSAEAHRLQARHRLRRRRNRHVISWRSVIFFTLPLAAKPTGIRPRSAIALCAARARRAGSWL